MVGSEWLPRLLLSDPGRSVVVLSRFQQPQGTVALKGDISLPQFGLSAHLYRELQLSVRDIIHCAADTRFGLPLEQARAVNTGGTQHVLEFAYGCPGLRRLAHISTVYVAGRSSGIFLEEPLPPGHTFFNTYQQSKSEAEDLVVHAMADLPAAIFRLSSLIGDSATGHVRQFNHVHQLLRLLPRNVLPVIPGDPDARVDLVPTDWAVAALHHLFESAWVTGRIYHVCAGAERSLQVRQIMEQTVQIFESHPEMRRFLPLNIPKLVSLPEFEAYVAGQQQQPDRLINELLRVLGQFLPHFGLSQQFDNRLARQGLEGSGLAFPPAADTYGKVVRYCIETNWGRGKTTLPT